MKHSKQIVIRDDDHVFVLTGAGISAESGLATFRGADGLWEGERVEDVASRADGSAIPSASGAFIRCAARRRPRAEPNPAHFALAELERKLGQRFFLCTQNVDNLHERAGSRNLVHMHGELFQSRCDRCARAPFPDTRLYQSKAEHLRCECGGRIRPNIVWFGEMPFHMERIFEELQRCTVMLVVGTSGVVQPAASFVHMANERPGDRAAVRTYYVGPEHPANATAFTQVFEGKAGELLPNLFAVNL